MSKYILQMNGITKRFPGVKALDQVEFSVRKGEIHALCGENGAGKSTLMKVLSGVYPTGSYEGSILLHGKEVNFKNTRESQESGIAIIYQELALIPDMTIAENIFLGHPFMQGTFVNSNILYAEALKWLDEIGLNVNPQMKVNELSIGKQQLIEIIKALVKQTNLLILDEPTAALTESDVDTLVKILKELKAKGVTCIYISHKLNEVMRLADTVTVLRDGRTISTDPVEQLTENKIITKMVGRTLTELFPYQEEKLIGNEIFKVNHYSFEHQGTGETLVDNVSFSLNEGEILGVSGLIGAGRSELFMSLFGGLLGKKSGEVLVDGQVVTIQSPAEAIKVGLAYVSEDRKRYGLVLDLNITKNSTLAALRKVMKQKLIDANLEMKSVRSITNKTNVKTHSLEASVNQLSGGNQQKVVLSKWLFTNPKVLILDEPTRGIDVGAKYEIYKIIHELAESGVGIVIISSELPEVLGISDRVLVMSEGKITGEFSREEATEEKIMALATGGKESEIFK